MAMNVADSAPKLPVNQHLPLRHYYRIADNLLRQARIYRSERNVVELYILLLRFTSLVIDTIPAHNEYKRFADSHKALLRQRVLEAVAELESLKPLVKKSLDAPFVKTNASTQYKKYDPSLEHNRSQNRFQPILQTSWQTTVRPREETVSRHSYFNLPISRKPVSEHPIKVSYPSYVDISHVEIPSLDQNWCSVSSSESTIPSSPPSQYSLVNQLAPPAVAVPVQKVPALQPSTVADPRPGPPKLSSESGPKHLHVSPTMMENFLALARHNTEKNLETCGVLAGFLEKGMFSVTTLIIPKQEATSDSCQTVNEEELFEVQDKRNLFQLGWIHTHPTQTCFMSSIDLHTHYSYQVMLQEAIAIVMAPTDDERSFGIFRLSEPGGMETIQQCDQRGFHPHDEPLNGDSIYDHCSHVYMNPSLKFDIVDLRSIPQARQIHHSLLLQSTFPSVYLSNLLIEMYGRCGSVYEARRVFDGIVGKDIFTWNLMLSAYAKNGYIREARFVFDAMPTRDLVSWTSMLSALAKYSTVEDAQNIFQDMPDQSIVSLTTILTAYALAGYLRQAEGIFAIMPYADVFSSTTMITAHGRHGMIEDSERIFGAMPYRDIGSWNAMLAAYSENGYLEESERIFTTMPCRDLVSWNSMLSALAQNERLESATALFDSMPERNLVSNNAMLTALGNGGRIDEARALFQGLDARNLVSYNTLLNAYGRGGYSALAREIFEKMPERDLSTWTATISSSADVEEARRVFESAPHRDLVLWNALLSALGQGGHLEEAKYLFDSMEERDIVSWSAMLSAFAQNWSFDRAKAFFEDAMPFHGVISFNAMLAAAAAMADIDETKALFDRMRYHNVFSWNSLLAAHAQTGNLEEALRLFREMPGRDLASWSCILAATIQRSELAKAQNLFETMPRRDRVSWTMMLSAYAEHGYLDKALEHFHAMAYVDVVAWTAMLTGFAQNSQLATAVEFFIDMPGRELVAWNAMLCAYTQNGHLASATRTFCGMPARNIVSWNAMLAAFSASVELLEPYYFGMAMAGVVTDETTFACALAAHSHAGNLRSGLRCFRAMSVDHSSRPRKQQYGCLINLLGRAGYLADARDLIESMPFEPDLQDWVCLLGACRIHGNTEIAASIAQQAMILESGIASPYVLLANVSFGGLTGKIDERFLRERNGISQGSCRFELLPLLRSCARRPRFANS